MQLRTSLMGKSSFQMILSRMLIIMTMSLGTWTTTRPNPLDIHPYPMNPIHPRPMNPIHLHLTNLIHPCPTNPIHLHLTNPIHPHLMNP
ncbi:hypothetical protein BDR03DRAFT_975949, partial [Suillus americanus]